MIILFCLQVLSYDKYSLLFSRRQYWTCNLQMISLNAHICYPMSSRVHGVTGIGVWLKCF